jgi:hypothetical protein
MVTLATGIMFIILTCVHFRCGEFYEGVPHVRRSRVKWSSSIAESLGNTSLCYSKFPIITPDATSMHTLITDFKSL